MNHRCNRRKIITTPLILCAITSLVGCIHYYPDEVDGEIGRDPTKVSVGIQLELTPTLSLINQLSRQPKEDAVYQRFVIEISRTGSVVAHKEAYIKVEESRETTEITMPFEIPLHAVEYDVNIWSDYSDDNTGSTSHYDATSLVPIVCKAPYTGNSELKVCHYATTSIDLRPYRDSWDYHHKLNLSLDKPVGKYQIKTTDIEAYLRTHPTDSLQVKVEYNDYHPLGYNISTNTPEMYNDGVWYETKVSTEAVEENGELSLAFDYIFVSPNTDHKTRIALTISDNEGEQIVRYDNIEISYSAGKVTTLYGKFLTQSSTGGIGINPNWDGEIIIEL